MHAPAFLLNRFPANVIFVNTYWHYAKGIVKWDTEKDYSHALAHRQEKGEKIGAEKERKRAQAEKIESAKKMLSDGLSIELVSKYSGLSLEEIERL